MLAVAALVLTSACDELGQSGLAEPRELPSANAVLGVAASALDAAVGERITVAVTATSPRELSGVQGYLRFDPNRLRFLGQVPDREALVIINESGSESGRIRLAAVHGLALGSNVAKFAFEVRASGYASDLRFQPEVVGDLEQNELSVSLARAVGLDRNLPSADEPVRWSYVDWAIFMDPTIDEEANLTVNIPGLPAAGTVYGDVTLNGAINVLDVSDVANTSVGNREVIIGTTAVDRVTAANVRPLASATCPVGAAGTDCSTRLINVLDVSPIAQEALPGGNSPVVGEAIALPKSSYTVGETVFIGTGVPGANVVVAGTRTFHRDTLYVLRNILVIGDEAGAAGDLVIQAGTRIEGELTSAIFVTRNGRIHAIGTPTEPIEFTCALSTAPNGVRGPGCWGGVFIAGNAILNEQDDGIPGVFAPAIPGRNPVGGQFQRQGEGGAVNYGGGQDADSSGVIRYARFAYGGRDLGNNNELNNLTVGACGTGTRLDHIQVHGGEDDGLEFFGGRCNVKYLYATGNDDDQFDYSFGYDGDVQFLVLQHCRVAINDCDKQFEVDNTEDVPTYHNLPRTNPVIYNVTSVGGAQGTGTSHIHYRRGASGTIRNLLVIAGSTGFTFDDTQTCLSASNPTPVSFGSTIVMSTTTQVAGNSGCNAALAGVGAQYDTVAYQQGTAGRSLKDPNNVILPDFRPIGGGITSPVLTPATPPGGGFFDASATYFGGVRPQGAAFGDIPWYGGWSMAWQNATTR